MHSELTAALRKAGKLRPTAVEDRLDPRADVPPVESTDEFELAVIASIKTQLRENLPVVLFLDTLNRSLVGSESKDEDMARFWPRLRKWLKS